MANKFIDDRLTTGANDGSSPANAFRSLLDCELGTVAAGDRVKFVAGSGPYRAATNQNSALRVNGTDISFDAATKQIRSAGTSLLAYNNAGAIVRVSGSALNNRQFTVVSATATVIQLASSNTVYNEAAGARIRVVDITSSNSSGNRAYTFDPGRAGGAGNPIIWDLGFGAERVEISAGLELSNPAYRWVNSARNPREWYCLMADGSNPSLNKPESGVVNGVFMCASATNTSRIRGTVGSLSFDGQYGFGDNDSLGFSTVYVRARQDPQNSMRWKMEFGQLHTNYYQVWANHDYVGGIWSFGNGSANSTVDGACLQPRAANLRWFAPLLEYADGHGFEPQAASVTYHFEQAISYMCGHRFCSSSNQANITINMLNCLDYGSHLFMVFGASAPSTQVVNARGCMGVANEAGSIDKKSASAILNESFNLFYPDMTDPNGDLSNGSEANWPLTAASDLPSRMPTSVRNKNDLIDPLFENASEFGFEKCNFTLRKDSPARGRGQFNEPLRAFFRDFAGQPFYRTYNIGPFQDHGDRPIIAGAKSAIA